MLSLLRFSIPLLLGATLLGSGCQHRTAPIASSATDCIDPARVNPNGICTKEYAPVCGCNGQTYANACTARNAGVRTFTTGPCAARP